MGKTFASLSERQSYEGKSFGRIFIREYTAGKGWAGTCLCGNEVTLRRLSPYRSGRNTSCGCLVGPRARGVLSTAHAASRRIKGSAFHRRIEWRLTDPEAVALILAKCHYCGCSDLGGIDRADSEKGYTLDNCLPCCKFCNYAKHTLGYAEFLALCKKVSINLRLV